MLGSKRSTRRRTGKVIGLGVILGIPLVVTLVLQPAMAVSSAAVHPPSPSPQYIKAESGQVTVFNVDLTTVTSDTLTAWTVRFNNVVGWSTGDVKQNVTSGGCTETTIPVQNRETACDGIQIWRDSSRGDFDDVLDSGDTPVSTGFGGPDCTLGPCDYPMTLDPAQNAIPANGSGEGVTYFVVIRTSSSIANLDRFTVSIPANGITTSGGPAAISGTTTTPTYEADTVAPGDPNVSAVGASRGSGYVHVSEPAVSNEVEAYFQIARKTSSNCANEDPEIVLSMGPADLTEGHIDLFGTTLAERNAVKGIPVGEWICYRVLDRALNPSEWVVDGQMPGAPTTPVLGLVGTSNVDGAKRVNAAIDTSVRTLRMYIKPGNAGDWVRAINEDPLFKDEWIDVTTKTDATSCSLNPPSTSACTTGIFQYSTPTVAGPALAAGDGVGYSVVDGNGNDGDVVGDGVIPAVPTSADATNLSVSAADGHQRLISKPATPGSIFGLYLDTTLPVGDSYQRAFTPAGGTVTVTTASTAADSGTTEIRAGSASGTTLAGGHGIAYVALDAFGNESNRREEGTIPDAPVVSELAFYDSTNQVDWNPPGGVPPANTNIRLFVGSTGPVAYGTGTPVATMTNGTPVSTAEQTNGAGLFYTQVNTSNDHESPLAQDLTIPMPPSVADVDLLSTSAASGHHRIRAGADANGSRKFKLLIDPAGGTAWTQATTLSNGSTLVTVDTDTNAASDSCLAAPCFAWAGATQLAATHAVGYALVDHGGNDSDAVADGTIPAPPSAANGWVSDATNEFTHTDAGAGYVVNLHLGENADTPTTAYNEAGPDETTNSPNAVAVTPASDLDSPGNDAPTIYYTASSGGNESATVSDGAIPAKPSASDTGLLLVYGAQQNQRMRYTTSDSSSRTFRLYVTPSGGSTTMATTTSGGSTPVEVTTSTTGAASGTSTSIFAGTSPLAGGWAVHYSLSSVNGHSSDLESDGTIPASINLADASATGVLDQVTVNNIGSGQTVRLYAHDSADIDAAHDAGIDATITQAQPTQNVTLNDGNVLYYATVDSTAGHESLLVSEAIPSLPARSEMFASDVRDEFILPGASATNTFRIRIDDDGSQSAAYNTPNQSFIATTSPFSTGGTDLLDGQHLFYFVRDTVTGNESNMMSVGIIPTPPGSMSVMSASAAEQTVRASTDSTSRLMRLYLNTSGGGASGAVQATTTAGGSTPVEVLTSSGGSVTSAQGIFAGNTPLGSGHAVFYSRIDQEIESDLAADGLIPNPPLADQISADASADTAEIAAGAVSGTYRVFKNSLSISSQRTHTSGTPTTITLTTDPTRQLDFGDSVGFAMVDPTSGNESERFVDPTPIPTLTVPDLQTGSDSGSSSSDNLTKLTSLSFDLTSSPSASVNLLEGAVTLGTATANGAGAVTITPVSGFSEGVHNIQAKASKDGNVSPLTTALQITVDITAPPAPSSAPDLDAASDSNIDGDNVTNDTTPLFHIAGTAGAVLELKEGATVLGSVAANGSGNGSITSSPLSAVAAAGDEHTIAATATDAAGNVSALSPSVVVTIDVTKPATTATPDLAAASDSGVTDDDITNVATPDVDVAGAESGSTVTLLDGLDVVGSATGSGTTTIAASLSGDGAHPLSATAMDLAGNVSDASDVLLVILDTTVPVAPALPDLAASSDLGSADDDGITNDNTPLIVSTGNEVPSTVKLFEGSTELGSEAADGSGNAQIVATALTDGEHTLTFKQIDVAGNVSPASEGLTITIDTLAPATPPSAPDLVAASDSGIDDDDVTNDATPSFRITGIEGSTVVALFEGSTEIAQAAADSAGEATVTPSSAVADGARAFTFTATDLAGNTSLASPVLSVTIDTVAPVAPAVPDLTDAEDSGRSQTDDVTNVVAPGLAVSGAEAGSALQVFEGSTVVGTATADGSGDAVVTVAPLSDGTHDLTVVSSDLAGNASSASSALSLMVDTAAPDAPPVPDLVAASDSGSSQADDLTNIATPDIAVSGEADAILMLFEGATLRGQRTGDGTITVTTLADGSHPFIVKAVDVAGNVSIASAVLSVVVDTVAPVATLEAPGSLTGVAKAVFDEAVTSVDAAAFVLRIDGSSSNLAATSVYHAPSKTVTLTPSAALLPGGSYDLILVPSGATAPADAAGNAVASVQADFRASLVEQEFSPAVNHGWRIVGDSRAMGGSYAVDHLLGSRLSFRFSGSQIVWYTKMGPDQGIAQVMIDGKSYGTFNNYSPTPRYGVARAIGGLSTTEMHNMLVIVTGQKGNVRATDTQVTVDAFRITYPSGFVATFPSPPGVVYAWRTNSDARASGGRYVVADLPGAAMSFRFRGTKVALFPQTGPTSGKVAVYIDGAFKGVHDLYSPTTRFDQLRYFGGLSDGEHLVRIVVLGQRNAKSGGTLVGVDRWAVG